jgi:hypothetical protein
MSVLSTLLSIEAFAAKRRGDQDDMEKEIFPEVSEALQVYPATNWYADLLAEVTRLYIDTYHREGGSGRPPNIDTFIRDVRDTLDKTENPTEATADRISVWLATAILNAATQEAVADDEEFLIMEWVTMHDEDVRAAHVDTEGQQRPPGEPFDVDGTEMRYPGDPTAPIALWINCRCTLAPLLAEDATFRKNEGVTMTATETETETVETEPVPWHGVLAPEGEWSGDGRMFADGALRFRDLPLPLTWQKATDVGHDGSVVVGKIEAIERQDGMMFATGTFLQTIEADEVISLIREFGKFGVSVDADDAEFEFNEEDGKITFTSARIASASVVSIPAFAEAFIALGSSVTEPDDEAEECDPESPDYEECIAKKKEKMPEKAPEYAIQPLTLTTTNTTLSNVTWTMGSSFISEEKWDGSAGRFTPEQWKKACVLHVCTGEEKSCHKLPIREPGGALSRAGVHAAASRFNQVDAPAEAKASAKAKLRGAYKQLGEEPPDVLKASSLKFVTASAGRKAPASWFENPELTGPTHLTVSDDGRVFGHIAEWETCHIGYDGVCVAPPRSELGYAYYATGRVLTDDGGQVRTGVISLGGGHAEAGLRANAARSHYDSTSTAVADVCVGEDEFGIWCAGWIRPGVTEEQIIALRASDVSGDWREVGGDLEMVAALAVNVAGFPVVSVQDGVQVALVAAGCIQQSADPIEALAEQVEHRMKQRELRRTRMKELAARFGGE